MPKLIVQTNPSADDGVDVTLSERVVAANLESRHYTAQLIERVAWAAADAEAIESGTRAGTPDRASTAVPSTGSDELLEGPSFHSRLPRRSVRRDEAELLEHQQPVEDQSERDVPPVPVAQHMDVVDVDRSTRG